MKRKNLLLPLVAAMVFAGCKSDEPFTDSPDKPVFPGDKAYLAVNIAAMPGTRATDGGFEFGSSDEHDVTSADFYFYDADGVFVTQANLWNGGSPTTENPNIEYFGNNIVALKGLTEKNYPKFMVTVLNQPEGFNHGATLADMEKELTSTIHAPKDAEGKIKGFVMTTTSYVGDKDETESGQPTYFTTQLQEGDFVNDPGDITDPVDIYVERLAAKVTVNVDEEELTPVEGEANTYEMKATIAGDPNAPGSGNTASETIRIRFDGWGLNATAKQSHIVKNIDTEWTSDAASLGFNWNENSNYRSLWGKGIVYDKNFDADGTYTSSLNYNTLNTMNVAIGKGAYCAENTNTADKLKGKLAEGATSVILAATVLYPTTVDGTTTWNAADLVRYSGVLYTESHFKNYVLNNLKTLNKLNYWKKTGENEYEQIGTGDIEYKNANGMMQLILSNETGWYKQTTTADGVNYDTPADVEILKTELNKFEANAYKDGKMYYNIPIEHLRSGTSLADPQEGHYGVVRNHHYVLTINKLVNIGKGVYDPDKDVIIPDEPDDPKNKYQVGVKINVLSWKIVSQNVSL